MYLHIDNIVEWEDAKSLYVTNVVNLMDSIRGVLESSRRAHALPHNYIHSTISAGIHPRSPPPPVTPKPKSKDIR